MQEMLDYFEKKKNPSLDELYNICHRTKSDINGHFPEMSRLASQCSHITEFGVRFGVSTVCWLHARPRFLKCYDIHPKKTVPMLEALAAWEPTDFKFSNGNTVEIEIEPTDMLFIDTYHTYDHLKKELELHADKVTKFIVMHDTESCGEVGGHKSGARGLKPAIAEFLQEKRDEWYQKDHFAHCNGLTVLKRTEIVGDYPEHQINRLIEVIGNRLAPLDGDIVEIGCWKGRSAEAIANKVYPEVLHAVDTWQGNIDEQNVTGKLHPTVKEASKKDIFSIFSENMRVHTKGNVETHQMDCHEFVDQHKGPIKFCHVDASHDYESVKKTLVKLLPKMVKGGIICGDDISSANKGRKDLEGGVERAVVELLPNYRRDRNFFWWVKP